MATVFAPSVILGERPDRDHQSQRRFRSARRAVEHLEDQSAPGWRLRPAPDASLTSLETILEAAPSPLVLLEGDQLPARLQGRVPLALLRRIADRHGKRVVLLSESRSLRRLSKGAGIEAQHEAPELDAPPPSSPGADLFRPATAFAALRTVWPRSAPLPRRGAFPGLGATPVPRLAGRAPGAARPLPLLSAVLAVLLLLTAVTLPAGAVRVVTVPEGWTSAVPITIDPALKRPDPATGRLPGRTISREITESAQAPATGRRIVPDAPATGQVVFVNKGDKAVVVPRGTVLASAGPRFQTRDDVTVGASVSAGLQQRVGMNRVNVVAVQGGPAGNVDRFQITRIEGPLSAALQVHNDAPTRGGTEKQVAFVTADDRRQLQESLHRTAHERLLQQVKGQLPSPDKETVVPWAGVNPQLVEATFSKNADEEATSVSLTLKLRYGATVFGNEAYNTLVRQLAAASLGQSKPGFEAVPQSVRPEPPELVGVENGVVRLNGKLSATVRPRLDPGELRSHLSSRTPAEARAYLATLPGVAGAEVDLWPGWLGRLPWVGQRISVAVADPGAPAPTATSAQPAPDTGWRSAPNGP
ncbi:MAG TPA: hypothetical protein VH257_22570 [Chloroflexota bacterium]|nr:hypothetical protein [Chloroflexota bacterium]